MNRLGWVIAFFILSVTLAAPTTWAMQATPAASPGATPTTGGELVISGTVTAKGRFIFNWQRDDLCTLSFWDFDFTPDLIVVDADGLELARLPMEALPGVVTMEGPADQQHAEICRVPYLVTVPSSAEYRVLLAPYFDSGPVQAGDIGSSKWDLDISFERQEGDPAPALLDRPSGRIVGTDRYLIDGRLEIRGNPDELDFLPTPFGCVTLGGYDDITIGTQIRVTDQTGTIVGVADLEPLYTSDEKCEFVFSIEVPDATFYTLDMGRRGEMTYAKTDLEVADWHVLLTIG